MLKYNSMFTHTYIYYSECKSTLNKIKKKKKKKKDKQNNKNLFVVYLFIHSLFNLQRQRM